MAPGTETGIKWTCPELLVMSGGGLGQAKYHIAAVWPDLVGLRCAVHAQSVFLSELKCYVGRLSVRQPVKEVGGRLARVYFPHDDAENQSN